MNRSFSQYGVPFSGTGNGPMQNGQGGQVNRGGGYGPFMMNGNGRGMMGGGFG